MPVSQKLEVTQVSQNIEDNTSQVRILWTSTQTGVSYNLYKRTAYYYVYLNESSTYTKYSVTYTLPKGTTKTIVDKTITVNHKTDGTGSIKVTTWMDTDISAGEVEKSASLTLDTIPRATTPTLDSTSVNMGSTVVISMPRASSSFTHDLAYQFNGGSWVSIATGVGTTRAWTVPDLAASIPNATSGTIRIRCITKNDSTTIGTEYVSMTAKIPSSVVPAQPSLAYSEVVEGMAEQFDAFIQGKSKIAMTVAATGVKGSTITAYQTIFQGVTYTGASFTTGIIDNYGDLTYKCRVKDSRGRWSAYLTNTIPVLQYKKPSISRFQVLRANENGIADDAGTYLILGLAYSVPELNGGNTASMTVEYKRSTEDTWSSAIYSSTELSLAATPVLDEPTFSVDYSYDVRMTVTDYFGATTVATATLLSGAVILDIKADGLGIAFGKTSEQAGIDFGWDIVNQVKTFGSLSGQYRTHDGLLIQWGNVNITPTAADTPTTAVVTFPLAYASTPIALATPITGVPQSVNVSTQRNVDLVGDNTEAMAVTLTRTGTTATGIVWLAIGKGADV